MSETVQRLKCKVIWGGVDTKCYPAPNKTKRRVLTMREIKEKKVRDIMLASFLKAIGKEYIGSEKEPDGKLSFVFQDNRIDDAIDEYVNGVALVNVSDFVQAYRSFKSVIYQKKESRNGRDE